MKKALFLLSNDFGELVFTRLFTAGQPFNSHVLLPDKLYNIFDLPEIEKVSYNSVEIIRAYIKQVNPDVIFIFCAYLFVPKDLLTWEELESIIIEAKKENIPVVTSDPFYRLYDNIEHLEPNIDSEKTLVKNILRKESYLLSELIHLYEVKYDSEKIKSQSFWNDACLCKDPMEDEYKHWTFILSEADLEIQQKIYADGFYNGLARRLKSITEDKNNCVNLVMPEMCVKEIKLRLGDEVNINYIENCQFQAFEALIAKSYVVFYWNLLSSSLALCMIYKKPVLFFNKGHMKDFLGDELFTEVIKNIYKNYEPIMVDVFSDFETNIERLIATHHDTICEYKVNEADNIMQPDIVVEKIISNAV